MKNITQEYVTQRILPDGKQKSNKEYYFKDGVKTLKDGHWEYLYDDGTLSAKGTFMNGIAVGAWQFFHENGVIEQRGFYKNDGARFHGDDEDAYLWKIYDEDGKELYTSLDDVEPNDHWIEEAEEYLSKQKEKWPWIDYD